MSDSFVEAGRVEHVDGLEQAFREVAARRAPAARLISLESRSGYGKTRVVQEFYRRLAREQAYWPPSLVPEGGGARDGRKRIAFRTFAKPQDAPPTFMWLGIDCDLKDGVLASDVRSVSQALRNHVPSAFSDGPTVTDGLSEGGSFVVEKGAEALGTTVFPVGPLVFVARLANSIRIRRALKRSERTARVIDIDKGAADAVLDDLGSVHRRLPEVPFVLVVEDAHDADRPVIELIRGLLLGTDEGARVPILVVTMAWRHRLNEQEEAARTEGANGSFGALLLELLEADVWVERRELARLPADGMNRMFQQVAPRTSGPVLQALVSVCDGNPYIARLLLERDDVRGAIHDGEIDLDPVRDVPQLPKTVTDAMAELWEQLPAEVKLVLAVSALQGREFVASLTHRLAADLPSSPEQPDTALELAVTPYDWVRRQDENVLAFFEHYNHELALEAARRSLWGRRLESSIAQRVSEMRQDAAWWSSLAAPAQSLLLAMLVRMARADDPPRAAELARELYERERGRDTWAAVRWAQEALDIMRAHERAAPHIDQASLPSTDFLGSMTALAVRQPSLMRGFATAQLVHSEALGEGDTWAVVEVLKMADRSDDAVHMARRLAAREEAAPDTQMRLVDALASGGHGDEAVSIAQALASSVPQGEHREAAELTRLLALLQTGKFGDRSIDLDPSSDDPSIEVLNLLATGQNEAAVAAARQMLADAAGPVDRKAARQLLVTALQKDERGAEILELLRDELAEAESREDRREARAALAVELEFAAIDLRFDDFFGPRSDAETRAWDEAVTLRQATLEAAESPDEIREAREALALTLELADRDDEARDLRRQVYADARLPDEVGSARKALRTSLVNAECWSEAIPLLEAELEASTSPDETAALERLLEQARRRVTND